MHRRWTTTGRTLTVLCLLASALPAFCQQLTKDVVPFKASWTAQNQAFPVATDPTGISLPSISTGQSDLWGAFTGVALATQRLSVDGKALYSSVVAEWNLGNGDALSVELPAIVFLPPSTAPDAPVFHGVLTIINGKGRYLGARGSAFVKGLRITEAGAPQGSVTVVAEGLITRPK